MVVEYERRGVVASASLLEAGQFLRATRSVLTGLTYEVQLDEARSGSN